MSIQQLFFASGGKTSLMTATGGTITYDGDYAIHSFTAAGTFTVTYKARAGLTYDTLLVGTGTVGVAGAASNGSFSGAGGSGGNGGTIKPYTALPVDTGFTSATTSVGAPASLLWGGVYNYYSNASGFTQALGGSGGNGSAGGDPGNGAAGGSGTSSSITGSAVVYGGAGGGGGGGVDLPNGFTLVGQGGLGSNGGGQGGTGGEADSSGGGSGSPASSSTYGTGGGGGGGGQIDDNGDHSGGAGGAKQFGIVVIRYKYQE
jgi:hypothetical protein